MNATTALMENEGGYMEQETCLADSHPQMAEAPRSFVAGLQVATDLDARATKRSDERLLVDRLKAGDHEAFDIIFRRHVNQVYRQALRLTGNEMDAEDVVQEVFLAVYKNTQTFRGQSEFTTWLYRLTVNAGLTKLRRNKRNREVSIEDYLPKFQKDGHHEVRPVADWSQDLDDPARQQDLQEFLKEALGQLGPQDRAVIVMSDLEGYADREIAGTLGLSLAAVKARLHRARLFLRGKLAVHLGYAAA